MIAIIKVIDEQAGKVIDSEYRMAPSSIVDHPLSTAYEFKFWVNIAKPRFNQKEDSDD